MLFTEYYITGSFIYVLIEYILYIIICNLCEMYKKKKEFIVFSCITIKSLMVLYLNTFVPNYLSVDMDVATVIIIYYFLTAITIFVYNKAQELSNLYISLKQIQKDQMIRDSLFKITHEIKNPLAVCQGYLDMLDISNSKQVKKYIPIIESEIKRVLIMLADLVDFTKIELKKELIDVNLLLEEVINIMNNYSNNKRVKLLNNIVDEEIYIEADYDRLKQVFINMIKNGIEAADKKNPYVKVESEYNIKNSTTKIVFTDNGCGMSDETLARYDKGFYTTKKDGTGLGVSLSKEIILAHDGQISYATKEYKGTTVVITLPKS